MNFADRAWDEPPQRWTPRSRTVLFAWGTVATVAVLQSALQYAMVGALEREWRTALLQFPRWLSWAFATPVVAACVTRWPLRAPHRPKQLVAHVAAACAITLVLESLWTQLAIAIEPARVEPARLALISARRDVIGPLSRLLSGAITYTAVASVLLLIRSQQHTQRSLLRSAALERDLARARVQAIKMQVHPHFLFNALNTIHVLIDEAPDAARTVVVRLSDMLRMTLARATETEVALSQELELLRHYLAIETVRFQDRLDVRWDVATPTITAAVPDLILQPLVENAVKHGIARAEGGHTLTIRTTTVDDLLVLEVINEGPPCTDAPEHGLGVGLATVRERLGTLYGTSAQLSLDREGRNGTVARITLPFRPGTTNSCCVADDSSAG